MMRYIVGVTVLLAVYFAQTEGAECCKGYTGIDLQWHDGQFCADYCCYQLSTKYVQCCDDIELRVTESQRDQECISWIKDNIWVPIVGGVVGLIIIIAIFTCCCCCGCCACCRNNKPGTVVVHQPPTAMQGVSVNNTMVNQTSVNPLHVGYDYS